MTVLRAVKFHAKSFACLLAVLPLCVLLRAGTSAPFITRATAPSAKLAMRPPPAPASANPKELSPVFFEETPNSIAELRLMERHVEAVIRDVSPAVVAVEVGDGTGSGVVITSDGLVLTAGHVCELPHQEVSILFPDGKKAGGMTLGVNENDDTGLIQITDAGPWPHAPLGDLKHAKLGDWTVALGHPGGFDSERPRVARLGRIILLAPGLVQTDCPLSPGDSGGPLFDMYGRVIAIHMAISQSMTENFHIPISDYFDDWTQLITGVRVREIPQEDPRAYCGATVVDDPQGCRLAKVQKNSPAERAGLEPGDLILSVEGRRIRRSASFEHWIAESSPGDTLEIKVKRGSNTRTFNVRLEPLPDDE